MSRGRIYDFINNTWNPIVGCPHGCCFCWARKLANTRLKRFPQYAKGFQHPTLVESKLHFVGRNKCTFVCDMGDAFAETVPQDWISKVLRAARNAHTSNTWFFETKNPQRYNEFLGEFPKNSILSTSIESDINHKLTRAPTPESRYKAFKGINWPLKHVAVEPILEFNFDTLTTWLKDLNLSLVTIGWNNPSDYPKYLPEPSFQKVECLRITLQKVMDVKMKKNHEKRRMQQQKTQSKLKEARIIFIPK